MKKETKNKTQLLPFTTVIEVRVNTDNKSEKSFYWNFLRDVERQCTHAANKVMTYYYQSWQLAGMVQEDFIRKSDLLKGFEQAKKDIPKDLPKEQKLALKNEIQEKIKEQREKEYDELKKDYKKLNDLLEIRLGGSAYKVAQKTSPLVPPLSLAIISQNVGKDFSNDREAILKGEQSLRNYRNYGIPINKQSLFGATLLTEEGFVWNTGEKNNLKISFSWVLGNPKKLKDNAILKKNLIEKIKNNPSLLSDSILKIRDNKMFLHLVSKREKSPVLLDKNNILGINRGIIVPIAMAIKGTEISDQVEFPEWQKGTMLELRKQKQYIRRELQKNLKTAKSGKGREAKLKKLEDLTKNERNFVKKQNEFFVKRLFDYCLKNNIGTIHIEDLSTFKDRIKSEDEWIAEMAKFVLRNWSYFELETMLQNKAKYYNMDVKKVNPAYISQKCCKCGHTSQDNVKIFKVINEQNKQVTMRIFHCQNCHSELHLDHNAAFNVANSTDFV